MQAHRFAVMDEIHNRRKEENQNEYRLEVWDKSRGELGERYTLEPDTKHRAAHLYRALAAKKGVEVRVFIEMDAGADGFAVPEQEFETAAPVEYDEFSTKDVY